MPQVTPLVREQGGEGGAEAEAQEAREDRLHLRAAQVEAMGGADPFLDLALEGEKVVAHLVERLHRLRLEHARRAQAAARRRLERAHRPALERPVAEGAGPAPAA